MTSPARRRLWAAVLVCAAMAGGARAATIGAASAAAAPAARQPDPAVWDAILASREWGGGFDYRGADGQDRKRLAAYLANLGDANPRAMAEGERKAFFVNAYNAMAVAIVLEHYPVASIRDVAGAFNSVRKKIGGEMLSLDDIEARLREARDARIHFAIVCASKSCPPLLGRAYRAATLSSDLDAQGRAFVRDSAKNVIDPARGILSLSQIFEWNRKEFERDAESIGAYVARFTPPAAGDWLKTFAKSPEFLPFDWALNQP